MTESVSNEVAKPEVVKSLSSTGNPGETSRIPGEIVTSPPFRPMNKFDHEWCVKSDRVSKVYLREIERVAGTGTREIEIGKARIMVMPFHRGINKSFLTRPWIDPGGWLIAAFMLYAPTYQHDTWMSICPMELQSHVNPIKWATGRVLVFGLGMGFYLREILKKRGVTEVVVIEREPDAIRLYTRLFGTSQRVKLVCSDAFEYQDGTTYDFAYVDIWREMDEAAPDMPKLIPRFKAKAWAYWGMERGAVEACNPNVKAGFMDLISQLHCPLTYQQARDIAGLILRLIPKKDEHL